jgi:hypothetical protein
VGKANSRPTTCQPGSGPEEAQEEGHRMTRDELYAALVRLCQDYGYTTDHTYDLLDLAINSIRKDEDA